MKTKRIILLLTTLMMMLLTSCEKSNVTYQIKSSHSMPEVPVNIVQQINKANADFQTTQTSQESALSRYNKVCDELQTYYDDATGLLPWSNLDVVIELYAIPQENSNGTLVKTRTITYRVI